MKNAETQRHINNVDPANTVTVGQKSTQLHFWQMNNNRTILH